MNSHERQVEKVKVIGRDGKERDSYKVTYSRSPEAEEAAEKERQGILADEPSTKDPEVLAFLDKPFLHIQAPHSAAKIIIATKIRQEKVSFKMVTSGELLADYLEGRKNVDGLRGYPGVEHIFLMINYLAQSNIALPGIIAGVVGERYHLKRRIWLFTPMSLNSLATQWADNSVLDLRFLPSIMIHGLIDQDLERGPTSTAQRVTGPSQQKSPPPMHSSKPVRPGQSEDDDPKTSGKGKKR